MTDNEHRSIYGLDHYRASHTRHWDTQSARLDKPKRASRYYHSRLEQIFRSIVPQGSAVLEIGCSDGDILAALRPARGIGIDISPEVIRRATARHPHLSFLQGDAHMLPAMEGVFEYIVLSDLVNDLYDVQAVFEQLAQFCTARTRLVLNFQSHLWSPVLTAVRKLGLATPVLPQNWLVPNDIRNMLDLAGFETIRAWEEMLLPLPVPLLSTLLNRAVDKIWPFRHLALTHIMVARPAAAAAAPDCPPTVSVIVPARNEAGNIANIMRRLPEMGGGTEIVFVEGGSTDNTYETIEREIETNKRLSARLYRQPGRGKGDAVRHGFAAARNDVLMILDADLTVPPENLPRFYQALASGHGEFINGVRLVYPMQDKAMRLLNLIGNKFFSLGFSYALGQPVKDTLCGTKVLFRCDYERIAAKRDYFGDFDPYGDFDLLFGAAKQSLKIVDLPIRYQERTYGETNISRWSGGWLLLRMLLVATRKLKFV